MIELVDVKAWLRITGPDDDAELTKLLDRTIDSVARQLDWYFGAPQDAVEVLNGNGLRALHLRQYIAGAAVTVEERYGVGDEWETVDSDDYEFAIGQRAVYHVSTWTVGVRNYRISYPEGFAETPGDIAQLYLDLVSAKWKGRSDNPAMKSETLDYYSYTRADFEQVGNWKEIKARWKRGRI